MFEGMSVEEMWSAFHAKHMSLVDKYTKYTPTQPGCSSKPATQWMNKSALSTIKKKRKAWLKFHLLSSLLIILSTPDVETLAHKLLGVPNIILKRVLFMAYQLTRVYKPLYTFAINQKRFWKYKGQAVSD